MECGIISYSAKVPYLRLPIEETIGCWKNNNLDMIKNNIGVNYRSVLSSDEDTLTLSTDAASKCINQSIITPESINAIILGTSTAPDLFKSNANQIMSFLTDSHDYIGFDVQSSESSGVNAVLSALSLVKSNFVDNCLAIGADSLSRHIFPSELRESYIGDGAAAMLIGNKNIILKFLDFVSYNSAFPEQSRPEDERFIRITAPLNHNVTNVGFVKHCVKAINLLLDKTNLKITDISSYAFNQIGRFTSIPIIKALKTDYEPESDYASYIGDSGSASPLLSLEVILDHALPGQKIILCGYGHSSGATAILFEVTEDIIRYRKTNNVNTLKLIKDSKNITYTQAMKYEFKYIQPNIALGTFI